MYLINATNPKSNAQELVNLVVSYEDSVRDVLRDYTALDQKGEDEVIETLHRRETASYIATAWASGEKKDCDVTIVYATTMREYA